VYTSLIPTLNFFMPVQKLKSKIRAGSKEIKIYDEARSPFQRLVESGKLSRGRADSLQARYAFYNPVQLQQNVNKAVLRLHQRIAQANRKLSRKQDGFR
jgi:hypothetical protein